MQRTIRFRGKATGKGNIHTNWVYGGGCFAVAGNTFIFADPTPKFMGNKQQVMVINNHRKG